MEKNQLHDLGVGSCGAGDTPLPLYFTAGEFNKIKAEIDRAVDRFWAKDQIRGWDENGKRIGTGIPRSKQNTLKPNEYSI